MVAIVSRLNAYERLPVLSNDPVLPQLDGPGVDREGCQADLLAQPELPAALRPRAARHGDALRVSFFAWQLGQRTATNSSSVGSCVRWATFSSRWGFEQRWHRWPAASSLAARKGAPRGPVVFAVLGADRHH